MHTDYTATYTGTHSYLVSDRFSYEASGVKHINEMDVGLNITHRFCVYNIYSTQYWGTGGWSYMGVEKGGGGGGGGGSWYVA